MKLLTAHVTGRIVAPRRNKAEQEGSEKTEMN
jgi:hypothetical protein